MPYLKCSPRPTGPGGTRVRACWIAEIPASAPCRSTPGQDQDSTNGYWRSEARNRRRAVARADTCRISSAAAGMPV